MTTPHVLTVISLFILGLNTRKVGIPSLSTLSSSLDPAYLSYLYQCYISQMGSAWIFLGMASKMAFELGLHRKIKSPQMTPEVKEMRDMAFWGCFVAEA